MAEQHVRALQYLRSTFDPFDYAIMEVICVDTGRNSEPARTSLRNIAQRAGCHYNTVASRIEGLAERGYLTAERKGKFMCYAVTFDGKGNPTPRHEVVPAEPEDNGKPAQDERLDRLEGLLDRLDVTIERLSQQIEALSQGLSHIVTTHQRENVTEVGEDKTPPTPPYPSNGSAGEGKGGVEEEKPAIVELAEYFCQIAGKKLPRKLNSTYADEFWWEPLVEIYEQHGDFRETKRAMYAAKQYADEHGLVIGTPHSLRNLATAGTRDKSGYRSKDGVLVVAGR